MTAKYRHALQKMREQANNTAPVQDKSSLGKNPVELEDLLLGDMELVTDANDLPSEVRKNLDSNFGPTDTVAEKKSRQLLDNEPNDNDQLSVPMFNSQ